MMLSIPEIVILIVTGVILVWPSWRICTKFGLPAPLGLLAIVPLGIPILLYVWAFAERPAR